MTENSEIVRCKDCEAVLNVRPDEPQGKRTPCPHCGSTSRAFEVNISSRLKLAASVAGVHYRWVKFDISYILGTFAIYTAFAAIGLTISLVLRSILGSIIGFLITTVLSFAYAFFIGNRVKVILAKFGSSEESKGNGQTTKCK